MKLPLHPFFLDISSAPTQLVLNAWSQMAGAYLLWKEVTLGKDMPLHVFQTLVQPRASSSVGRILRDGIATELMSSRTHV